MGRRMVEMSGRDILAVVLLPVRTNIDHGGIAEHESFRVTVWQYNVHYRSLVVTAVFNDELKPMANKLNVITLFEL